MRKLKFITNRRFGIFVLILSLIITQGGITGFGVVIKKHKIIRIPTPNPFLKYIKEIRKSESKKELEASLKPIKFKVTAYDLSVNSTGKSRNHPAYGISRGGVNLKDKTWNEARAIAVDPNIIPLGSTVLIEFVDDKYKKYNSKYLAVDTGNAIVGKKIDLFLGDFQSSKESKEVINFGVTTAFVTILD